MRHCGTFTVSSNFGRCTNGSSAGNNRKFSPEPLQQLRRNQAVAGFGIMAAVRTEEACKLGCPRAERIREIDQRDVQALSDLAHLPRRFSGSAPLKVNLAWQVDHSEPAVRTLALIIHGIEDTLGHREHWVVIDVG